jgi:hypothetical protein
LYFLEGLILTWLIGTPVSIFVAWWLWIRARSRFEFRNWRQLVFLAALIATTLNELMYGAYLLYWWPRQSDMAIWAVRNACSAVSTYLCGAAFIGAIAGESTAAARILVLLSAVLGYLLWVPIGIL